ncbi:MAG TPA: DHA2 family efflux MFS transporter permease subunit [Stellaceae bacterium]|jgi:DHA2 family multidrug resistance protein|nr:DHA2 family efflux MFS transporter permease subunit [Stellaceae bacterium]
MIGGTVANRTAITISIMLSVIMRGLDNTIANVALAHIQGSLSVSQEEVSWVLTSYIVSTAIAMPLTGWIAGRLGIKYVFLVSVIIFTVSSALCGAAVNLEQLVFYRILQGFGSAALVPLSQATLLQINPPERHGQAMAVFGTGTILGPIAGPAVGGFLTDALGWRWVFYVNVPIGIVSAVGIALFIREARRTHSEAFDFFGFLTLSVAIGALQLLLDRGEVKDWFGSTEIWVEATIGLLAFYLLVVHTATTTDRSFVNRDLLKNTPFVAGTMLVFLIGVSMNGTLALLPLMLQDLMNYPVMTTGVLMMSRGIGTMLGMFVVGRLINKIDVRLILVVGMLMLAFGLWQMTGFSLQMNAEPVIVSGLIQGFGFGCTGVPLNIIALSNLPRHILTQGTAIRGLMRNLGGSVGIPILVAQLVENTQIVHARLVENLRPDNPMMHHPFLAAPYSLTTLTGLAALDHEVTRQASMTAYIDDFKLMMIVAVASLPLVLLLGKPAPRRADPVRADPAMAPAAKPAAAD